MNYERKISNVIWKYENIKRQEKGQGKEEVGQNQNDLD
jgi:hypothetical protein